MLIKFTFITLDFAYHVSSYGKFTQLENKLIRHFLSFYLSFFPSLLKLLGHNYCLFRFQRKQIVLPLNFSIYFFVFICCLYFHNWRRIFKSVETHSAFGYFLWSRLWKHVSPWKQIFCRYEECVVLLRIFLNDLHQIFEFVENAVGL